MADEINPALTPEEWGAVRAWPGVQRRGEHTFLQLLGEEVYYEREGAAISFEEDRHALAALALHGKPFGFEPAHVSALRGVARSHYEMEDGGFFFMGRLLNEIADRIAALLPPEEP